MITSLAVGSLVLIGGLPVKRLFPDLVLGNSEDNSGGISGSLSTVNVLFSGGLILSLSALYKKKDILVFAVSVLDNRNSLGCENTKMHLGKKKEKKN